MLTVVGLHACVYRGECACVVSICVVLCNCKKSGYTSETLQKHSYFGKKDTNLVNKTQNYVVNTPSIYKRIQLSLFKKSNDLKFD